jgi:hypothetical protein
MTAPEVSNDRELPSVAACLILIGGFLFATVVVGWWGTPVVGLIWGWWAARYGRWHRAVAPVAAAGAVVAWAALLAWTAVRGPLRQLTDALGALTRVPGPLFIVATLLFGALLAWSAAALVDSRRD